MKREISVLFSSALSSFRDIDSESQKLYQDHITKVFVQC